MAGHLAEIDAGAGGDVSPAIAASDHLMSFVDGMFDVLEREVSPSPVDCSVASFDVTFLDPAR